MKNKAYLLSDMFKSGQFPFPCKRAEVIPVNKKSNTDTFKGYRLISIFKIRLVVIKTGKDRIDSVAILIFRKLYAFLHVDTNVGVQ